MGAVRIAKLYKNRLIERRKMILWDYAKKSRSCDIIYYKEVQRDLSTPKHKKEAR